MTDNVAVFTNRPPVNLFEQARIAVGTTFQPLITPPLYAAVDAQDIVQTVRNSAAVITSARLTNTGAQPVQVDFNIRSSLRTTYETTVTAQAGENWVRIDRANGPTPGLSLFGYDWESVPPVQLADVFEPPAAVGYGCRFTSDSRYLAFTVNSNRVRVYDFDNAFDVVFSFDFTSPAITTDVAWSTDDRYLAVGLRVADVAGENFLAVFDLDDIQDPQQVTLPSFPTARVDSIAWGGPSGRYMVVANRGSQRILVYDWNTGSPVVASFPALSVDGIPVSVAWSPDGRYLAVKHTAGDNLTVFDWNTGTPVKVQSALLAANTNSAVGAYSVAWSPDSRYLATSDAANGRAFIVFDFQGGVTTLPQPEPLPTTPRFITVAWSADGRYLLAGHTTPALYQTYSVFPPFLVVYDLDTGTPQRVTSPSFQGYGAVNAAAWSPDNKYLIVAGFPQTRQYPLLGFDNIRLDSEGQNLLINGSFEDTTGMTRTDFGYRTINTLPGWFNDAATDERIDIVDKRILNTFATDGSNYLNVIGGTLDPLEQNNVKLRQNLAGLVEGQAYTLSFDVKLGIDNFTSQKVSVLWNGSPVEIDGETVFPIVEDRDVLSIAVPAGESVQVPLDRSVVKQGEQLQVRASGAGVACVVSYVLSTDEAEVALGIVQSDEEEIGE